MQGKVSLYTNKLLHTYQHLTPAIATKTTSNTLKIVVDSAKSSDSFHLSWKSMDKGGFFDVATYIMWIVDFDRLSAFFQWIVSYELIIMQHFCTVVL